MLPMKVMLRILAGLALATAATAEPTAAPPTFYRQLYPAAEYNPIQARPSLLDRISFRAVSPQALPLSARERENLAFNYLWLQRYRDDADYKEGGAALGKLLRMGIKSLYSTHKRPEQTQHRDPGDDTFSANFTTVEYRFHVREDQVDLRITYTY